MRPPVSNGGENVLGLSVSALRDQYGNHCDAPMRDGATNHGVTNDYRMNVSPVTSLDDTTVVVTEKVPLARNAGALFIGQAVELVVPLLTIPYLARVLGPVTWG